jgi:competence protein ComEC
VLVAALVVSFLVTGWAAYPTVQRGAFRVAAAGYSAWPDSLEVRVLDIGQGNAVLMRTPDHRAFLFDGGPAGCGLGGQLRSLGVTTLDLVVISHPHADHFAGLLECLGSVSVKALVDRTTIAAPQAGSASAMANRGQEARDYLDFRSRLDDDGCRHLLAHTGLAIKSGGVTIQIYSPERPLPMVDGGNPWALRPVPPSGDELNAGSVVALVSWGNADFLLPGDAEAGALAEYNLPSAEVLVVPHHGSAGGVSPEILQELKPEVAVISVGEGNTFGHPDASTVRLLEATVPTVVRTDEAGWVCFDMQEDAIRVSTERRAGP